eukprot:TRINITY_DN107723_c0_g1_i1.p1 TRINITY_DN107723_c0_g1~~TRINITY_DN107723_c0_g1_i1.p1  ORF type:complete len:770 (-),score=142.19 TRINITY_DN107723_c0_g1_i1:97-2406(-)
MYVSVEKIRCASLASAGFLLISTSLSVVSTLETWWAPGSPKQLFNLDDAPPVVAGLWSFRFHDLPSYVEVLRPRDPATWEEYCAMNDARLAAQAEARNVPKPTGADDEAGNETARFGNGSAGVSEVPEREENEEEPGGNDVVSTSGGLAQPEDPLMPPGACHLVRVIRVLLLTSIAFAFAGMIIFLIARCNSSIIVLVFGAGFSGVSASSAVASVVLAGVLGFTGLMGSPGVLLVLSSIACAVTGACTAVVSGSQAFHEEPWRQIAPYSNGTTDDLDESPQIRTAEMEDLEVGPDGQLRFVEGFDGRKPRLQRLRRYFRRLEDEKRETKIYFGGKHMSKRQQAEFRKVLEDNVPKALKQLLEWGKDGRYDQTPPMPDRVIEEAFLEIDADDSGSVTIDEFIDAASLCGLTPSRKAVERMLEEVDKGGDGKIDAMEFYCFFRAVEETLRDAAQRANKAKIAFVIFQFLFAMHVVWISILVIVTVRNDIDEAQLEELDRIKRMERQVVDDVLKGTGVTFVILFWMVVFVPMWRLTTQRTLQNWYQHFDDCWLDSLADLKTNMLSLAGRRRSEASTPPGVGDEEQECSIHFEEGPPDGEKNRRRKAKHVRKSTRPSSQTDPNPEQTFGRKAKKRQSQSVGAGRKSSAARKSHAPLREGWQAKEEGQYNPENFAEANARAIVALSTPTSTYTPMQVRNVNYAVGHNKPPLQSMPRPPEGTPTPMFLPGELAIEPDVYQHAADLSRTNSGASHQRDNSGASEEIYQHEENEELE